MEVSLEILELWLILHAICLGFHKALVYHTVISVTSKLNLQSSSEAYRRSL